MPRPRAATVVFLLSGAAALYLRGVSARRWDELEEATAPRVVTAGVDLTVVGTSKVVLPDWTATGHHGSEVTLLAEAEGPEVTIAVIDAGGQEVQRETVRVRARGEPADRRDAWNVGRIVPGDSLAVSVVTPHPTPLRADVVVRPFVCELLALPAMVTGLLATVCGLTSGVAGCVALARRLTAPGLRRRRPA